MREPGKRAKKAQAAVAARVKGLESTLEKLALRMRQIESSYMSWQEGWRESERTIASKLSELQNQVQQGMASGPAPQGVVTLEEGSVVNLEELEKRMEERYSHLTAREKELERLRERMATEFDRLKTEMQERDLLLAAREVELRSLNHAIESKLEELQNLAKGLAGGKGRAPRLVSFLVDIGKRH